VAATVTHGLIDEQSGAPLIGASAAIAGVRAAYLLLRPTARITARMPSCVPRRRPSWAGVGGWFFYQAIAGGGLLGEDNVAYGAQIGGFVAGLLLIPLLKRGEARLFSV